MIAAVGAVVMLGAAAASAVMTGRPSSSPPTQSPTPTPAAASTVASSTDAPVDPEDWRAGLARGDHARLLPAYLALEKRDPDAAAGLAAALGLGADDRAGLTLELELLAGSRTSDCAGIAPLKAAAMLRVALADIDAEGGAERGADGDGAGAGAEALALAAPWPCAARAMLAGLGREGAPVGRVLAPGATLWPAGGSKIDDGKAGLVMRLSIDRGASATLELLAVTGVHGLPEGIGVQSGADDLRPFRPLGVRVYPLRLRIDHKRFM